LLEQPSRTEAGLHGTRIGARPGSGSSCEECRNPAPRFAADGSGRKVRRVGLLASLLLRLGAFVVTFADDLSLLDPPRPHHGVTGPRIPCSQDSLFWIKRPTIRQIRLVGTQPADGDLSSWAAEHPVIGNPDAAFPTCGYLA
jgi:hypothetical protein